jgi:hypothetical protein
MAAAIPVAVTPGAAGMVVGVAVTPAEATRAVEATVAAPTAITKTCDVEKDVMLRTKWLG